ncbi:MAG TPA: FAD binding domain-containing protein [Sporichthyaceae bacterium]|nr:FAD binding domain-containing protein [Sporichthyaceae bacterium]
MTLAIEAPGSIGEALELLAAEPARLIVAGGTDLLPALNSGRLPPRPMLALGRLREIDGAGRTADGGLFIGAGLTLARAQAMAAVLPALARAASVGPPGVRTAATVGGNVVSARGGDLLPLLTVLDARVETDSVGGRRSTPIGAFLTAAGRADGLSLCPGELVVGMLLPALPIDAQVERLVLPGNGSRAALSLAVARFADEAGFRLAVQVGTGLPMRVAAAEEVVAGQFARSGRGIDDVTVTGFAAAVAAAVDAGAYLRHAASVCARRILSRMVGAG